MPSKMAVSPLFCISITLMEVRYQRMGAGAECGVAASWYFGGASGVLVLGLVCATVIERYFRWSDQGIHLLGRGAGEFGSLHLVSLWDCIVTTAVLRGRGGSAPLRHGQGHLMDGFCSSRWKVPTSWRVRFVTWAHA